MIVHLLCIMASCNCIQLIKSVWITLLSWHSQKFKLSIGIETLLEKASACQLDSITIKISWDCTINFLTCVCFSSFFCLFMFSIVFFPVPGVSVDFPGDTVLCISIRNYFHSLFLSLSPYPLPLSLVAFPHLFSSSNLRYYLLKESVSVDFPGDTVLCITFSLSFSLCLSTVHPLSLKAS